MKLLVKDVMTREVVSVDEFAPFKQLVVLLQKHRISALPVVTDSRRVVGVVSEADLLVKEGQPDMQPHLLESRRDRDRRGKASGRLSGELMTGPAITIGPEASVVEAARLMQAKGIKRLPVVDEEGKLAGIVSRADLLQAFLRPDDEIWREVVEDVILRSLWLDPQRLEVRVANGVVTLGGEVDRRSDRELIETFVLRVDGVVGVQNHLRYRYKDPRVSRTIPPVVIGGARI